MSSPQTTPIELNAISKGYLPEYLGIIFTHAGSGESSAYLKVHKHLLAPNGYLHAGTVVTLADSCTGYGCMVNLPKDATGFTTIELKSNHLGTAREGVIECSATLLHGGKTTQVWDAVVRNKETQKTIALFRCTQLLLYGQ